MNHTPGPWKWWTSNSWKRLLHEDAGLIVRVLEPFTCSDGCSDVMVSDADARLIAAAPELLDALKALRGDEWRCTVDWGSTIERDVINAKVDAAIKKAEG